MPATIIHVNSHTIRGNRKTGERRPPLVERRGRRGKPRYFDGIEFAGHAKVVYDPEHPLPCGAVCWIEVLREWDIGTTYTLHDEKPPPG